MGWGVGERDMYSIFFSSFFFLFAIIFIFLFFWFKIEVRENFTFLMVKLTTLRGSSIIRPKVCSVMVTSPSPHKAIEVSVAVNFRVI